LLTYFAHDVEGAVASFFSGRLDDLKRAGKTLGGYPPTLDVSYDHVLQFDALPRIPEIMLFNDADDEFPATCSILFESRAETYLDPECIAMLGWQLFNRLRKAVKKVDL